MDRKEFLKTCAGGLCACAGACLAAPAEASAAEAAKPEDWRWGFLKKRHAKLLQLVSEEMDEEGLRNILVKTGIFCSSEYDAMLEKYRGDVAGFGEHVRQSSSGDSVTYDRENNIITMTSPEREDCFCPLNGVSAKTPGVVCNCSLGWQQHSWEKVLQKKVRVELVEAVLQGGKRCTFKIHILDQPI
jgi:predicted ArsR family transcriptional regulator